MRFSDLVVGVVLLALALGVFVHAQSFPPIRGQNVGPSAFPSLLAALLMLCAALLAIRGWRARHGTPAVRIAPWVRLAAQRRSFAVALISVIFYILVLEPLGFIVSGAMLVTTMFAVLGIRLIIALPLGIVIAIGVHTIFYGLLRVPLPWGVLQPIAW